MQIFGIDFTSAPSKRKPITCASCRLTRNTLSVNSVDPIPTLDAFEQFLDHGGRWVCGLDFPFGLPRKLIQNLCWSECWEDYVERIEQLGKEAFVNLLLEYSGSRPYGDRHHRRAADTCARAGSPMMVYGVPLGRMFFEGATRLRKANVSVLPNRPLAVRRVAIETYPALLTRSLVGNASYKRHSQATQSRELASERKTIVDGLTGKQLHSRYEIRVTLESGLETKLVRDESGDSLDAVLCAIQAAWASRRRSPAFGISEDCDSTEGWICDPSTVDAI